MISSVQRGDLLELSQVEAKGFGGGNESSKQRHRNALEQTEESAVMQDSIPNNLARMRSKTKLLKLSFFRFSLPFEGHSTFLPFLPSFPLFVIHYNPLTLYSTRLSPIPIFKGVPQLQNRNHVFPRSSPSPFSLLLHSPLTNPPSSHHSEN